MKKKIYKSVFTFEVLSDEPIPDNMYFNNVVDETYNGEFSGQVINCKMNVLVKGKRAVKVIRGQGSDPEFFGMDDNGNEIE